MATFDRPTQYAPGIAYLFINGEPVIAEGKYLNRLAGRVLTPQNSGPADLILKVGRVWTGDEANPTAEAVASRNGVIVFVGSSEEVDRFQGPATRLIDRPGDFAMPGLIDAHGHMTSLGASAFELDLRDLKSPEAVARKVEERLAQQPGDYLDHRPQLGSVALAGRGVPVVRRARQGRSRPTSMASPGRRTCRLGQFRGHEASGRDEEIRSPRPTARF